MNAFDLKKYKYNKVSKAFDEQKKKDLKFHGNAIAFGDVFRDRYEILLQRIKRNATYALSTTSDIAGTHSMKYVFGMLCQKKDCEPYFYLQDLNGELRIDLSQIKNKSKRLFTLHSFVICEGSLHSLTDIFVVLSINMPVIEHRLQTIKIFNNINFYNYHEYHKILNEEKKSSEECFVFISHVFLDLNETFVKLKKLFFGFSQKEHSSPSIFVFMGNFTFKHIGTQAKDMKYLQSLFDKLRILILKYPKIYECSDFVFISGPRDPCNIGRVLPQPPIRNSIVKDLIHERKISCYFQSNPFHIRFCTQDIVIFREDLLQKFRRNIVFNPELDDTLQLTHHMFKTILDQGCLLPLQAHESPIMCNFAHAFNLYPAPSVIVLGDTDDGYQLNYNGCIVCCPGNFSLGGSFVLYTPSTRKMDISKIR